MNEFELQNQGCILDENTISELDFTLWSDTIDIPENTNKEKHKYNQWALKRTRNACVLYANAWVISDLTWYKFSEAELLEICDLAEKTYWWNENSWMTLVRWTDCLRNWWNKKFPENTLTSFRLTIWDKQFAEALQKKHSLVVWYYTSKEYYLDSQLDWIIDWENFPRNWWHAVRTNYDETIKIDDNYEGKKKFNTYINDKIEILKNNYVYFPSAYLFLKDKTMEETIKENIDLERAKKAFDLWLWNWLNPREPMSRQEVMTVLHKVLEDNKLI